MSGDPAPLRRPDGFAYRYPREAGGRSVKFNRGETVNGVSALDAVPYWLGAPPELGWAPVEMVLYCPKCGRQHVDAVDWGDRDPTVPGAEPVWNDPPHRSHRCNHCRWTWRPADIATRGVLATKTVGQRDGPALARARPADPNYVPAVAEVVLLRILQHCERPNPQNPHDWRVRRGAQMAWARAVDDAFRMLGELLAALDARPPRDAASFLQAFEDARKLEGGWPC